MWTGLRLEGKLDIYCSDPRRHSISDLITNSYIFYLILLLSKIFSRDGRPQPDNRVGNEQCLAVLNNFYNDGVKFHDVACHHRKPVICER